MSDVEKRSDQAEGLRTRMIDEYKQEYGKYPPRSEIHKGTDKKRKLKMKYPIISILALFFILLPVFIYLYYGSQEDQSSSEETIVGEERVYISKIQQSNNQSLETSEPQNITEDVEIDEEENTEQANVDVESEESLSNIETTEKQNDAKVVNSSSSSNESNQTEDKDQVEQYREIKTHKVAAGETLFSIAIKYYNSRSGEDIIREYNHFNGNEIFEGQILKIPIK
ncbi:MAG TPA: LysM peptidoglycan-binding domain-containing protein [Metabacillus sp.]|nr:LysM peptidoglycan-binding domain-containing protein [Metabacillus sp.]